MCRFIMTVAALVGLLLMEQTSMADVTVVYQLEATGEGPGVEMANGKQVTIRVKQKQARMDMGDIASIIADGEGMIYQVVPSAQGYLRSQAPAQQPAAANPPTPTGKKRDIQGHACEEFIIKDKISTTHAWVAKAFPDGKEIMAAMDTLNSAAGGGSFPASELGGMVVESVTETIAQPEHPAMTLRMTLTKVERGVIDGKEFKPPAGFTDMTEPAIHLGKLKGK